MHLTLQQRKLLTWIGYPLLALVVFAGAAWASFPAERLRTKIIASGNRAGFDITIGSLERGFMPGSFVAENVIIKTRPDKPNEKPAGIAIDELEIDIGVLALMRKRLDVEALARLGSGEIIAAARIDSDGLEVELETQNLQTAGLPGLGVLFAGLKPTGGLDLDVSLNVPERDWSKMDGTIALACDGCTVEGKVKPNMNNARSRRMAAFASEGVTLPQLRLGEAGGKIVITDGRGEIESLSANSPDGEVFLEGYIEFTEKFLQSKVEACARFKFSDGIKKKNPKIEGMEAGMERARRTDGYIGMRWHGTFDKPRRIGSRQCVPGERPGRARRNAGRTSTDNRRTTTRDRTPPRGPTVTTRPMPDDKDHGDTPPDLPPVAGGKADGPGDRPRPAVPAVPESPSPGLRTPGGDDVRVGDDVHSGDDEGDDDDDDGADDEEEFDGDPAEGDGDHPVDDEDPEVD